MASKWLLLLRLLRLFASRFIFPAALFALFFALFASHGRGPQLAATIPSEGVGQNVPTLLGSGPAPAVQDQLEQLPPARSVAFLFLTLDGSVSWPEVWAEFFEDSPPDALWSVFVHRSDGKTEVSAGASAFLGACRGRAQMAPSAPGTRWGQLIAAERSLAAAALAHDPFASQFVILSDTTLPVKPFRTVQTSLLARGDTSSFCLAQPADWARSRAEPSQAWPKTAQWKVLSRPAAEKLTDPTGDAVAAVQAACGSTNQNCHPATSEEMVMAYITGPVPAAAMGTEWLSANPLVSKWLHDSDREQAFAAELALGLEDGSPVNATFTMPGVNSGVIEVQTAATNHGRCDTIAWWDDLPADAALEPAYEPFALFQAWTQRDDERVLDDHVDRLFAPWHPQAFGREAMTADFLVHGLCASKALFARKFPPSFTLRLAPLPRFASGAFACPAVGAMDAWAAAPHERIDAVSCDGMERAPLELNASDCRAYCCALGPSRCTAWQWRGRWTRFHGCWVGAQAGSCTPYGEAKQQLWRGERLLTGPLLLRNETAERAAVVAAFRRCLE